jgi:cytochrome c556
MMEMYPAFRRIGAVCAVALLAACNQAPAPESTAAAVDEDSPAYRAYEYRHGLMHVIGAKAGTLRGMAMGNIPPDDARFTKAADDLAALSTMMLEGFPEGSGDIPGSRALPDIWMNWGDFQEKVQAMQTAAAALADAANTGGFAGGQASVDAVAKACGGCHRPYRAEEE